MPTDFGPAFILGNSPWLPVGDLGCLDGHLTIGVNRILKSGFSPTVLLWIDGTVYEGETRALMDDTEALLVCDNSVAQRQDHHGLKTWVGDSARTRETTPGVLCCNGNTGCCAARWAFALGCQAVYLVGMDASYADGRTNFWGQNRWHTQGVTLDRMRTEVGRLRAAFGPAVTSIHDGAHLRHVAGESHRTRADMQRAILEKINAG